MELKLIAAVSLNGVMGDANSNSIPWQGKFAEDFKFFRKMTTDGQVIFGRKTYESIGKPLPKRTNIVITRLKDIEGVFCYPSLEHYINKYNLVLEDHITNKWICGGSNIYREAMRLPELKEMYITIIPEVVNIANPVYFPFVDPSKFKVEDFISLENSELKVAKYVRVS